MSIATNPPAVEKEAPIPASSGGHSTIGYMPFLDGLRAVSILLVLAFHQIGRRTALIGEQVNGWVGVELFFIISGFLITSILLKEQDKTGSYNLKNFYVRRWLRLCPAYYTFLLFMMGFMIFRGEHDFAAFALAGLYLTNIDMCLATGLIPASTGLLHSWSLCVEEQFYLLWPGAMKLSGKKALPICLSLIAAVYLWRLYLASHGTSWMYLSVGLDTKLDSIMCGVAIALLWRLPSWKAKAEQLLKKPFTQAAIAGLLLVACHFVGHPGTEEPMIFWALKFPIVLMFMSLFLVSLLANQSSPIARFLSTKPMVWIGRLSYSLYLWHVVVNFPITNDVFQTICHHKQSIVEIAKYATCFGLAAGSYYLIEQPFLKLKRKFS
jgi:peptidoglycan/LPS O-acetylase OafA/YrhL